MKTYRQNATIVGILFIFAIVTLFIGQGLYSSIFDSADYLETIYPNRTAVTIGILIELVGVLGLVFIPILLFPVLKDHNEAAARGYISIRLFEAALLTAAQVCKLVLINLSQGYIDNLGSDVSYFVNAGDLIKAALVWNDSGGLVYLVVFVIGMGLLYSTLYKSKLVPRWLSIWGLIAAAGLFGAAIIGTFELLPATFALILMLPTPLQEVTMSIWLIVKGFNPDAISSGEEQADA